MSQRKSGDISSLMYLPLRSVYKFKPVCLRILRETVFHFIMKKVNITIFCFIALLVHCCFTAVINNETDQKDVSEVDSTTFDPLAILWQLKNDRIALKQAENITVTAVPLPSVPAVPAAAVEAVAGNPSVAAAAAPPIPVVPVAPAAPSPGVTGTISNVVSRIPCSCVKGQCGCCSGPVLASFNQKACLNITYEPNEFAFNAALSLNGQVFYTRRVSGKNPPPICVRVPRLRAIRVCVKLSNVYFTGANMHTCVDMEANWEDFTLFETSFDCFRIGANGVALVPPEAGGGVGGSVDEDDDDDDDDDFDDYDDTARFIRKKIRKL